MRQHNGGVYCITVHERTQRVFTGSNDFTCLQWSTKGEFLKLFAGHKNGVRAVLPLGPLIWTASDDQTVRVWDVGTCKCLHTLEGHKNVVYAIAFNNPFGDKIVTGSFDKTCKLWDANTGALHYTLRGQSAHTLSLRFSTARDTC